MAVKASATVTLSCYRDTQSVTRYYKLQSSTASAPSKPTSNPPSGWNDTEPSYTSGSTNTLYFCDLTEFSDGTWAYSTVSKSSSYEAAKEAYNKAQNAQNSVDEIPNYIASRGENLVTNGTCLLGNNKNFSGFSYDGSDTYYAGGCFKYTGRKNAYSDEYIPIDVGSIYQLSYYIKCDDVNARHYDMLVMFDIDKKEITSDHVMYIDGSTTTLAKDLKNGDTVVYLTNASGFDETRTESYRRGLIFWNYKNSNGYEYEPETYSRNVYFNLWSTGSTAINKTSNTITLDYAWNKGTFPAGTSVSQCSSGGTYIYGNGYFPASDTAWTKKTAKYSGVGRNNQGGKFREGTAFVKIGWLVNYYATGDSTLNATTKFSTIELTKNPGISDLDKLVSNVDVEYYLSTSATSLSGGSWQTTAPTWVDGKYMWSRTKITDGAGNVTYSPSQNGTCIAGATGSTGATGKGVSSIVEEYYKSTSATSLSGGNWSTTYPGWENGKYIWTRSVISYTDNSTPTTTTAVCVTGQKGDTGSTGPQGKPGIDFSQGKMLNTDPMFLKSLNSCSIYNNKSNGTVTVRRIAKSSDNPFSDATHELQITTSGEASPGLGGIVQNINSRANAIFIRRVIAKIPVGYSLSSAENSMGSGYKCEWLTDNTGTGQFKEYVYKYTCGGSGSFSSSGYMYLSGPAATESSPVVWHVAYCTTFDMTSTSDIIEVSDALDAFEDVIVGTQTAKTGSWTGVAKFKELRDGQRIAYWLPYAGDGNATLNLTLSDGSTTGAKNCYYGGTSRITTHYSAGNIIHLTYRENVSISGSSTKYTGWWADANYNADTYDRTRYSQAIKAGTTAIVAGNIIVAKDGLYTHLKLGNAFDVSYPILYAQSAISASSTGSNNYLTIPFDISTTQSITFTAYKPVYIKGKLSGTIFTPVSTAPLTQTVPTTNDGYQYILLGTAYSTSSMYLLSEHPIFQYFDGGFKTVEQIATEAAKTATNYMKFNNGLIIGDMTNSTLGNNVFIDSDSVDIRTGETILASYEGNKISLGKNSENSTIDFCDGSMLLTNKPSDMWGTRFEMLADRCVYINAPILVTIDSYYRNEDSNAHSYIDLGSAGYDATTDSFIPGGSVHISTSTDNGTKSSSISLNKDSITLFSSGEGGEPFITLDGSDNKISLSLNPYIITSSGGSYRCILSNYFNGYSGLTHSDGSVSNWMRTTVNGLIPFESGGNSSSLGTSGWPFKNGYFKTLYSDDIYLANGTSVYGKNTSGSNVSMMGISSDNNLFIGAATEPQFDYTNIYAGSWIQLSANRTGDITSHVLQFFREQSSDKRTILRGATNGAIYLGTGSFRYNTAFFTNAITASDLKEKEVIEDFDFKIEDFIMGLNPIAYRRTGDNDTGRRIHMGFGAQDVSSLLKDISIGNMSLVQACVVDEETVTKTDESGIEYTEVQKVERPYYGEEIDDSKLSWGLNYNEFIAPLVLFVQKQQREIEKLKARCEVLEKGRTL